MAKKKIITADAHCIQYKGQNLEWSELKVRRANKDKNGHIKSLTFCHKSISTEFTVKLDKSSIEETEEKLYVAIQLDIHGKFNGTLILTHSNLGIAGDEPTLELSSQEIENFKTNPYVFKKK